jgi:hypothetical protein
MAKETGQESKLAGQDAPLYKAWLSNGQEHLRRVFGRRLAIVLIAFAITLLVILAASLVGSLIWYLNPIFSANDKLSTTDRKDLVQGFASVAQAAAVGLAGAVGLVGLFFTWRSLRQARESQAQTQENTQRTLELTEQGQITERFTRAIDQLGATDDKGEKKLEIRLGGIYALERIDKESPERAYHRTVMEVLTTYIREDSRRDRGESSRRKPPADIQAILHVLNRRELGDEPKDWMHHLDLQGANLQGANLQGANLQGANLQGTNLQGAQLQNARLQDARLQGANLRGAHLQVAKFRGARLRGADLREADLQRADLQGADLQGADLLDTKVTDEQLADTFSLQGATMPSGQKYEDWLRDEEGSGKDTENE